MKFNERFFAHEREFLHGRTLEELFLSNDTTSNELFAKSGLMDFRETLLIQQEAMSLYPVVDVKELRRAIGENTTSIDKLYFEPMHLVREFNRIIKINAHIEQSEEKWGLGKGGQYSEQETKFTFHILDLLQADWFPFSGDDVFYAGNYWTILFVKTQPVNYYQQSSIPCYLECDTKQTQFGDTLTEHGPTTIRSRYDEPFVALAAEHCID